MEREREVALDTPIMEFAPVTLSGVSEVVARHTKSLAARSFTDRPPGGLKIGNGPRGLLQWLRPPERAH